MTPKTRKIFQFVLFCLTMVGSCMFSGMHATPAKQPFMFRHITTSEGLTNNSITALYRDSKGYLWVGTSIGLNRYDSYKVIPFLDINKKNMDNAIRRIFEDWDGHVWAETSDGYAYFDYATDRFNENTEDFLNGIQITDSIVKMGINRQRNILWAYSQEHLFIYNKQQNSTKKIPLQDPYISWVNASNNEIYLLHHSGLLLQVDINTLSTSRISIPEDIIEQLIGTRPRIFEDHAGGLWLHTYDNDKLFYKQSQTTNWKKITLSISSQNIFNRIHEIAEDANGNIWAITGHSGVFVMRPGSDSFLQLVNKPFQPHTIASDNVTAIHTDDNGGIWLGTFKKGISYYSPKAQPFFSYKILPYNDIISIYETDNHIWLGSDGGGLLQLMENGEETRNTPVQANVIQAIKSDTKGNLWIGSFQKGLVKFNRQQVQYFNVSNSNLASNIIYDLFLDKDDTLWIATLDGYIQKLDTYSLQFETIFHGALNIRCICYDGKHTIYAATSLGLMRLDMNTGENDILIADDKPIISLIIDSRNIIWMGNSNGITYYNLETKETGHLTTEDGLSSNAVTAIAEDNYQQIWVGTAKGLNRLKYSNDAWQIARYYESDGLASNSINERAIYKLKNGNLIIGTPFGYTTAIPQDLVSGNYKSSVRLTGLYSSIPSIMEFIHEKSLEETSTITLPEGINPIVASFSTLDFDNKEQTTYYMRLNESNSWIRMDKNQISSSWLPAGTYNLEIAACNSNGEFSPYTRHISVHIYPPFYRTKTAFVFYVLLTVALLAITYYIYKNRRKKRAQKEAIQKEHEHQKKEMNMKLQFFANVSHELRTPLTLIINPLEEFIAKYPQFQNSLLTTASQNSKYLLELINQLLDFRKLDAVGENISYVHCDVVNLVLDQFKAFESLAKQKGIEFTLSSSKSSIMMDCDYDKLRKITINILSNAFKFTPNGGHIHIDITNTEQDQEQRVVLSFQDDGCGISEQDKDKIFNCFYQVEKHDHSQGGSGIGLYLVKQYVELHKGTIQVEDNQPQGTIFTISLPLRASSEQVIQTIKPTETKQSTPMLKEADNYTILVVDDNQDFLNFLAASISTHYNVLTAANGEEALNIVARENVDLIISDIMMPVMNGLQLCQSIKSDIRTSHIPIILLTARAGDEYQVEGFNYGADDYITKPFSMEILKLRVNKMLENKLKRQEQFDREVKIEPSKITITPLDQQFIQKAIQVVENNLENSEFSVEMLAEQLNLSRGHLYKKLTKITGKNPIDFIRVIRLKRAQQFLQESQMQISEIAYKLGYNSPKLFTKHFKDTFGMTPSEYITKCKIE